VGEGRWGAAQGLDSFIYLTIGTGIGGGGMLGGQLLHGLIHPEMGHIRLPHDRQADPYPGCCPFHGDCLEGLASGPAIEGRWGQPAATLAADHPAWALEAEYLALALVNFVCTLSPQRIVMGAELWISSTCSPWSIVRSSSTWRVTCSLRPSWSTSPITSSPRAWVPAPECWGRWP